MMTHVHCIAVVATIALFHMTTCQAQSDNRDESKVLPYTLPDPLVAEDGTRIETAEAWREVRRPEILNVFTEQVYGRSPPRPEKFAFEVVSESDDALGGRATRKEVNVWFT